MLTAPALLAWAVRVAQPAPEEEPSLAPDQKIEEPEGLCLQPTACAPLSDLTASEPDGFLDECAAEACVGTQERVLRNDEGQLVIPDATVPLTAFVGAGTPSDLVYADGRLQFTVTLNLENPFVMIESDLPDCFSDDIGGICACFFEPLGTYDIVVDLEIEAPA